MRFRFTQKKQKNRTGPDLFSLNESPEIRAEVLKIYDAEHHNDDDEGEGEENEGDENEDDADEDEDEKSLLERQQE